MCKHDDVKIIAARSGEWWWCEDCGSVRDPECRWFKPRTLARVSVALRDQPEVKPGRITRVEPPASPPAQVTPKIDPFTPQGENL